MEAMTRLAQYWAEQALIWAEQEKQWRECRLFCRQIKEGLQKRQQPKICRVCNRINPGERKTCLGCGKDLTGSPEIIWKGD